jgi:speckle-type POZ protein
LVGFQVGGKSFKAHRNVLCARSSVFAAMFQPDSGFDEALKGQLPIHDSTPEAVEAMLHYLYTSRVAWPERGVTALQEAVLKLADKYALPDLKAHVEGKLAETIDWDSFFHLVYLADDHQCEGLKRACVHYFAGNRADIVEGDEWGKLKAEKAALAAELLEAGGK